MATLSINEAWNETAAFAKREAHLLFPVAFLLISLPGAVLQALIPPAVPGAAPQPGLWMAAIPVAILLSLIGTLAITHLALRPGSSVGESLQLGARRFIHLLGAVILVGLGGAALMFVIAIASSGVGAAIGDPRSGIAVAVMLLLALPTILFFWVRLMLMTPVAAAESGGPIAIIARSWALTRGHFWPLLGFVIVLIILLLVLSIAVGAIGGLIAYAIAGAPRPGSLAMFAVLLLSALFNAVVSALFATFLARIYAQLTDLGLADVFAQPRSGT
jgi:hypothetical protein